MKKKSVVRNKMGFRKRLARGLFHLVIYLFILVICCELKLQILWASQVILLFFVIESKMNQDFLNLTCLEDLHLQLYFQIWICSFIYNNTHHPCIGFPHMGHGCQNGNPLSRSAMNGWYLRWKNKVYSLHKCPQRS